MASYLVTGVSRGIGLAFLKQLSANPDNTVVGLVRDKKYTDEKVKSELSDRKNIHIFQADVTDYKALKASVPEVEAVTGGKLDYIIANAGLISYFSGFNAIGDFASTPEELEQDLLNCFNTNVVGNIHLFNLYVPLILKGTAKKVIAISSGMADLDMTNDWKLELGAPYSISKAALNLAISKFHAQYADQGVLFLSICPGMVDNGREDHITEEQKQRFGTMVAKFSQYSPTFNGPRTTEASVKDVLSVVDKASLKDGYGGAFLSHHGNKQWV